MFYNQPCCININCVKEYIILLMRLFSDINFVRETSSVFVEFVLGSKDSAVTVGVLEGPISIRDHKGDLSLLQQNQVGQKSLLQPVDGEVVLAVLEIAAHPVVYGGVLLSPGVGRGDDEERQK